MPRPVVIDCLGRTASRVLGTPHAAHIGPVLDRCFYMASDLGVVCIGLADIGRGPLNALVARGSEDAFAGLPIKSGDTYRISSGGIEISNAGHVDVSTARLWEPPPWSALAPVQQVAANLIHLQKIARPRAGSIAEALWHPPTPTGLDGIIARRTIIAVRALVDGLRARMKRQDETVDLEAETQTAIETLLGLGPGFTPTGDDVLAGLLLGFAAAGLRSHADWIASAIQTAPAAMTTRLSRAFFDAAAEGQAPEAFVPVVQALLEGNLPTAQALQALDTIGHTSGWDMLAGLWVALTLVADASIDASLRGDRTVA